MRGKKRDNGRRRGFEKINKGKQKKTARGRGEGEGEASRGRGEVSLTSGFLSAVSATRGREGGDTLELG